MQFIVELIENPAKVKVFISSNILLDGFRLLWHAMPREDALIASRVLGRFMVIKKFTSLMVSLCFLGTGLLYNSEAANGPFSDSNEARRGGIQKSLAGMNIENSHV